MRELGRVELAAGDLDVAERRLDEALAAFDAMDAAFEATVTRLDLAELSIERGSPRTAARHLAACRRGFLALGVPAYLKRAESLERRLEGLPQRALEGA
jgi:hypothetical protein